jgi:Uma2 family endonuclease
MAARERQRATYQDLLNVPDRFIAELIDGELYASPRPRPRHSFAAIRLSNWLGPAYDRGDGGPGGWLFLFEPELHLGEDALVPDLAGWRRERIPEFPETAAIDLAPGWVCEVTSPSTGRLDRIEKLPAYANHSVSYAWLIDPEQRSLEVLRLENGRWVVIGTHARDQRVHAEPFSELELNLSDLWPDSLPTP